MDHIPPSTCRWPSITTGVKYPGMAQEAVTASRTEAVASRPNTTRTPSSSRTVQIHIGWPGQAWKRSPIQLTPASTARVPSGSSAAAAIPGR